MNVLEKYNIEFILKEFPDGEIKPLFEYPKDDDSELNYQLLRYFMSASVDLFEEILIDIDNALSGLPFDDDGAGAVTFLQIGRTTSYLYPIGDVAPLTPIPTQDLKEILLAWIEFVNSNPSITPRYR
ncbi:hypothetical protein [Sphingobacterium cellulitidis]|uniref:hypothetical protein n=1 Tax=Sphingobacterium cellulitidis TaxID=1768011 RepID=UPI001181A018|nr:hypothetical protein [Sphingobacterium cellulitidis]